MACSFEEYSDIPCGPSPRAVKQGSKVINLNFCCRDIRSHCRFVKISGIDDEVELILSRVRLPDGRDAASMNICPMHRDKFGIGWRRKSRKCAVPLSVAGHKQSGAVEGGISKQLSQYILDTTDIFLEVGAG